MNNDEYFSSINEVSMRLSLPAHTLRYWEKQFPAAIKPTTGAGGRRYYRPETVQALGAIKDLLYNRGMTIAGVKKIIKNGELNYSPLEGELQSASVAQRDAVGGKKTIFDTHHRLANGSLTPPHEGSLVRDASAIAAVIELLENAAATLANP